jgi:hypothetical protein
VDDLVKFVCTPALEEAVLDAIENAPGRSIRGLPREFQVAYRRILADEYYSILKYVQALGPCDPEYNFANGYLNVMKTTLVLFRTFYGQMSPISLKTSYRST